MGEPVTDRLHEKQGRSIGRRIFVAGDSKLSVYLKRHYRLPWWRRTAGRALPEAGVVAGIAGVAAPRLGGRRRGSRCRDAVAAGQLAGPWFRLQSFLAVEELARHAPLAPGRSACLPAHCRPRLSLVGSAASSANSPGSRRELHRRSGLSTRTSTSATSTSRNDFTRTPPRSWAEPGGDDRPPSPRPPPPAAAVVASQGPRTAPVFVGRAGRHCPRPGAVLEAVPHRLGRPRRRRMAGPAACGWKWRLYVRHARRRKSVESPRG